MLNKETCSPRFRVVELDPIYDGRDAITGFRLKTVAVAQTQAFAEFKHGQLFDESQGEARLEIRTTDYRRVSRKAAAVVNSSELPF